MKRNSRLPTDSYGSTKAGISAGGDNLISAPGLQLGHDLRDEFRDVARGSMSDRAGASLTLQV